MSTKQNKGRVQDSSRPVVWTIAGFDPSSGAGITADLLVFGAHGLFGCSAITALTVQNTVGVFGMEPVSQDLLQATLQRLAEDLSPGGVKVGMLASGAAAQTLAVQLALLRDGAERPWVVLDPVLRSSSGHPLFPVAELSVLQEKLLPHVDVVTPNWAELAVLTGQAVSTLAEARQAATALQRRHSHLAVVATGGDQAEIVDLLVTRGGEVLELRGQRVETRSTHGTGCAFSSALLSKLVRGKALEAAVEGAQVFVQEALRLAPGLGAGRGPMELLWPCLGAQEPGVATLRR